MIPIGQDDEAVGRIARVNLSGTRHRQLCLIVLRAPSGKSDFIVRFADGEITSYYRTCLVPLNAIEMIAALEIEPAILATLRRLWTEMYEPFHRGFDRCSRVADSK